MRLLTILCLVLLSSCSPPPDVPSHRLVQDGGVTYEVGSNNPYTGVSSTFDQDGQLERKKEYENGIELSDTTFDYYDDGQLWIRENYKDGKRDGLMETFGENDQLSVRGNFKNGEFDGLLEYFGENGQLENRGNFKDGKLHGLVEYFDENGNLTKTEEYKDGELIE